MLESNYSKYIKEREGLNIIEKDYGFVTYSIKDSICFIHDIYISSEDRKLGLGHSLADEVVLDAKEQNCNILKGSVCPMANNATEAMKFQLAYNMKLEKSTAYSIVFWKEI